MATSARDEFFMADNTDEVQVASMARGKLSSTRPRALDEHQTLPFAVGRYCAVCDGWVPAETAYLLDCKHILHWSCIEYYNELLDNHIVPQEEPLENGKKRKSRPTNADEPPIDNPSSPICPTCTAIAPHYGCPFDSCKGLQKETRFLQRFRIAAYSKRFSNIDTLFTSHEKKLRKIYTARLLAHMKTTHKRIRCTNCNQIVLYQHHMSHATRCSSAELNLCPTEGCGTEIPNILVKHAISDPSILLVNNIHRCESLLCCSLCYNVYLTSSELLGHGATGECTLSRNDDSVRPTRKAAKRSNVIVSVISRAEAIAADAFQDDSDESSAELDGQNDPRSSIRDY